MPAPAAAENLVSLPDHLSEKHAYAAICCSNISMLFCTRDEMEWLSKVELQLLGAPTCLACQWHHSGSPAKLPPA